MTTEVIKSVSIENMVNQRAAVVQRIRQALDLLAEAETLAVKAHVGFPRLVIDSSYTLRGAGRVVCGPYASPRPDVEAAILRTVDAGGWAYLMGESGMRTFMDARAREQWDEQLHKGDIPELTAANVRATFGSLLAARGDMFERGVLHVFRRLSWDYKTNCPVKFGKRIIVTYLVSDGRFPNHRVCDEVDDMVRVFHVLDGKPEPDHRQGTSSLIYDARREGRDELETPYLRLKWFKNGNGHLTFKRPDLVEQMNRILAKHHPDALPAKQ